MQAAAIAEPVEQELELEVKRAEEMEVVVDSPESFEYAGEAVLELDAMAKKVKEYWAEPKRKAYEAHREITRKESEMLKPIEERRKEISWKINTYLTEQERKRQEEQRRLDDERRKAEEAERARLAKQAEKAEAKGDGEKAAEIREKADTVYIPPAIVEPEVPKTTRTDTGTVSQRKDLEVRIVDMMKLLAAVVAGVVPIGCVTVSEAKLKQYLKLNQIMKLDGCEIREVVTASYRGK